MEVSPSRERREGSIAGWMDRSEITVREEGGRWGGGGGSRRPRQVGTAFWGGGRGENENVVDDEAALYI